MDLIDNARERAIPVRLQRMGALALAALIAAAAYEAWSPLYQTGRAADTPFIAGCEAWVVIALPAVCALLAHDRVLNGERVPISIAVTFIASIAIILFICDYRAATAAAVIMRTAPVLASAIGVAWLIVPPRGTPVARIAPEDRPLEDPTILYRFYGSDGTLLYVGITKTYERRLAAHSAKKWWPEVGRIETQVYGNRRAAARAEHAAIHAEDPLHNVARLDLDAHLRTAAGR